jgi:hypothetical protein
MAALFRVAKIVIRVDFLQEIRRVNRGYCSEMVTVSYGRKCRPKEEEAMSSVQDKALLHVTVITLNTLAEFECDDLFHLL